MGIQIQMNLIVIGHFPMCIAKTHVTHYGDLLWYANVGTNCLHGTASQSWLGTMLAWNGSV